MSRIGNKVIQVPAGVTVDVKEDNFVTVKGPKGELSFKFDATMKIVQEGNQITVSRPNDEKTSRTVHGTTRALLNNMVVGVSEGFKKQLSVIGVGYRVQVQGNTLVVNAGYSHPVNLEIPAGIKVECPKNTDIIVSGADKIAVGEFAANIRSIREPEPYKGKGIRYVDEKVRRKEGKTAKK